MRDSANAVPKQLTNTIDRLVPECWTPHGLVLRGDRGGNEIWQLSLLAADGQLRALTRDPSAIHTTSRLRPDGQALGLSWNPNGQEDMVLGELTLADGAPRPWLRPQGYWNWLAFSPDGGRAVVAHMFGSWNEAYVVDRSGDMTRILPDARLVSHAEWTAAGLFLVTDGGDDFMGVAHVEPEKPGTIRRWVVREKHDVVALVAAPNGAKAAVALNVGIYDDIRILDLRSGAPLESSRPRRGIVVSDHSGDQSTHISWSLDSGRVFVSLDRPTRPADIVAYPEEDRWTHVNENPEPGLHEPSEVEFRSFDGLTIPALEYRIDETPRPTVCLFHGGPEGQWRGGYTPLHHLLNASGINVFCPNVRGSTGYGFRFQSLDDKTQRWNSVKDGCEAARWLRREGRATRVAAMGGSYGGFMTLAVLVECPDLWDAAVESVGIARFKTFFERMPPWRGVLRTREYGDPFGAEADFLESISPLHHASSISTPLLVVHGRNDPRVPVTESEQIARAAKEAELLIFENEGHGVMRHENQLTYHRKVLEFLRARLE